MYTSKFFLDVFLQNFFKGRASLFKQPVDVLWLGIYPENKLLIGLIKI
jgi:hypothetical protein